jgi:Sec-independent protein secretion pathway component TatC
MGARQVKFVVGLLVGLAIAGAAFSYFYSVPAHCGHGSNLDTSVYPFAPLAQPRASRFGVMKWKDE